MQELKELLAAMPPGPVDDDFDMPLVGYWDDLSVPDSGHSASVTQAAAGYFILERSLQTNFHAHRLWVVSHFEHPAPDESLPSNDMVYM